MLLTVGVFLFNLLCGLVPCDPTWKMPEVRSLPLDTREVSRNMEKRQTEARVQLPLGSLEGYHMKAMSGRDIFAFEGIRYGVAKRWRSPVPVQPWSGIKHAKKRGSDCLQISLQKLLRVYGNEDCLFLNVFTPDLPNPQRLVESYPVIVFIHGGSFLMGTGSEFGPSYLLNQDVVLVTLNYRLGVLGFLSTGDKVMPGNYGLKDQALALKWVHENIVHFGGNPKNVSLWGNSAGAVSVNLHMISNKTRDYFSTAFSSSGTAMHDWAVQSNKRLKYLSNRLATRFGCQNEDSRALIKCLSRIDSNVLVAAQLILFDWFPFPPVHFSPTVEPEHPDAFLTISPEDAYRTGAVAKKPFVVGMTKDEGKTAIMVLLLFQRTIPLRFMWKQIAPVYLGYKGLTDHPENVTAKIEDFYFHGKRPYEASLDQLGDMSSDRYLSFGTFAGVQAHSSVHAPTYLYYFSFRDGKHNLANTIGYQSKEWGVGHTEDMYYLFNDTLLYDGQSESDPDHELSSTMVNLLTNFVATGEPLYRTTEGNLISIWEPVTNGSQIKVLQLDREVKTIPLPKYETERTKFWNNLNLPNMKLWSPI